jgi:hypothetical protein
VLAIYPARRLNIDAVRRRRACRGWAAVARRLRLAGYAAAMRAMAAHKAARAEALRTRLAGSPSVNIPGGGGAAAAAGRARWHRAGAVAGAARFLYGEPGAAIFLRGAFWLRLT